MGPAVGEGQRPARLHEREREAAADVKDRVADYERLAFAVEVSARAGHIAIDCGRYRAGQRAATRGCHRIDRPLDRALQRRVRIGQFQERGGHRNRNVYGAHEPIDIGSVRELQACRADGAVFLLEDKDLAADHSATTHVQAVLPCTRDGVATARASQLVRIEILPGNIGHVAWFRRDFNRRLVDEQVRLLMGAQTCDLRRGVRRIRPKHQPCDPCTEAPSIQQCCPGSA